MHCLPLHFCLWRRACKTGHENRQALPFTVAAFHVCLHFGRTGDSGQGRQRGRDRGGTWHGMVVALVGKRPAGILLFLVFSCFVVSAHIHGLEQPWWVYSSLACRKDKLPGTRHLHSMPACLSPNIHSLTPRPAMLPSLLFPIPIFSTCPCVDMFGFFTPSLPKPASYILLLLSSLAAVGKGRRDGDRPGNMGVAGTCIPSPSHPKLGQVWHAVTHTPIAEKRALHTLFVASPFSATTTMLYDTACSRLPAAFLPPPARTLYLYHACLAFLLPALLPVPRTATAPACPLSWWHLSANSLSCFCFLLLSLLYPTYLSFSLCLLE